MSFDFFTAWFVNHERLIQLLIDALGQTLTMVFVSGAIGFLFGIPLGVLLHLSKPRALCENAILHRTLSLVINIGRSVPFIILLVAIIPLTRLIIGTSIGTGAAIVPLTIGAIPFIARLVEAVPTFHQA